MAQADYDIASNPSGLALRLEVNEIFKAIQTINSGATPPSSTEAGMWWGDISDPNTFYLKMRNHTNDGWVNLYAYDVATSTIRALSNNKYLAEITGATGAVFLPSGTTTQRPTLTSSERALRYNTDNTELEVWDGTTWDGVGGDLDINSLTDKATPNNTDNIVLQETGGLLKKLSWSNLKTTLDSIWVANDTRAKTALNASGTAPIYACRAWVNFNGTGTVAIIGSGNVSSITDNGSGTYTINFATAMPDTNYAATYGSSSNATTNSDLYFGARGGVDGEVFLKTTTQLMVLNSTGTEVGYDSKELNVVIFR